MTALSAVVAALGGVIVGGRVTARIQNSSWVRNCRFETAVDALNIYAAIYDKLQRWCTKGARPEIDWAAWNQALSKLSLTATPEVAAAAFKLDGELWRVDESIKAGRVGFQAWLEMRGNLECAQLALANSVRVQLVPGTPPLKSVIGRPDQSDPMWTSWRNRHPDTSSA